MGIPTLPIQTSKRRRRPVCLAPATVAIDKDLRLIDKVAVGVQTVMISHHHDIVYVVHVHVTRSNSSSLLAARCNATASQSGFRGSNRPVARRPAAGAGLRPGGPRRGAGRGIGAGGASLRSALVPTESKNALPPAFTNGSRRSPVAD